jgi:hypothetical protein
MGVLWFSTWRTVRQPDFLKARFVQVGTYNGAVSHVSQAICRADPISAFFAEIDAVVLRKLFQESTRSCGFLGAPDWV